MQLKYIDEAKHFYKDLMQKYLKELEDIFTQYKEAS